ncbi:hypothetical protein D3C73_1219520 [compost metagenome]
MLFEQLAIEDETAGAEDHPLACPHPARLGEIPFQLADLLAQFVAIAGGEVLQAFGAGSQSRMQLCFLAGFGHAPELGAQYPPLGIGHQSSRRRLQQRLRSGLQARGLEVGKQHCAALPFAHGAMPSWCRRQGTAVIRHQFVTRVIEEVAVGWV